MKKILLFLLACLTAASLLAACAEKPGENGEGLGNVDLPEDE